MAQPIYSHGGPSTPGFPAVAGTTTTTGNPIYIFSSAIYPPALNGFFTGTSCTVVVEGNGGLINTQTGQPPSGEWIDYSNGGYALTTGQSFSKALPPSIPCWRTRITAIVLGGGAGFFSYVPAIVIPPGDMVSAGRPPIAANAYNPNT